jgi:hypothetical protein
MAHNMLTYHEASTLTQGYKIIKAHNKGALKK